MTAPERKRRPILRAPKRAKPVSAPDRLSGLFTVGSVALGAERIAAAMRAMSKKGDDE